MKSNLALGTLATLALTAALGFPARAHACGGTFCDTGPTAMPVDQSGEKILFVYDGTHMEAHVQIEYRGDPERFAWVVPMPAEPTVSVGSQPLFNALSAATVPTYGFSRTSSCPPPPMAVFGSGGATSAFADAGVAGGLSVTKSVVGSFITYVLTGGTTQEVVDWLSTNGYEDIPAAPSLISRYVAQGHVFVAVKLTAGAGSDEIHPLVFRFQGDEPCIPLELTAVAAVPDMAVRAFFLGDDRVVPTNYAHATLNPARLDWLNLGGNYTAVVNRAVDGAPDGHAFITEYAGPSNVVPPGGVRDTRWDAAAFVALTPAEVLPTLAAQGLVECSDSVFDPSTGSFGAGCAFGHPLIAGLLREFLPVPAGIEEAAYYSCIDCFATASDAGAAAVQYDGAGLSTAIQERIVDPGDHAVAMLNRYPYLTRMFTTISPEEMTLDPTFHPRADLDPVPLPSLANLETTCNVGQLMTLPDGRGVAVAGTWPAFTSEMPWVETLTRYTPGAAPEVLEDNSAAIDAELSQWNLIQGWVFAPAAGDGGVSSASGGTQNGPAVNGRWVPASSLVDAGADGANALGDAGLVRSFAPPDEPKSDEGCGCTIPGTPSGHGNAALALGALALVLGRRRRG